MYKQLDDMKQFDFTEEDQQKLLDECLEEDLLREELETFIKTANIGIVSREEVIKEAETLDFKYEDEYYKNVIFNELDENVPDKLDIELEFVDTSDKHDLWKYFKVNTSSIKTQLLYRSRGSIGFLVKDKNSGKYLGILKFTPDVISCGPRDGFIWCEEPYYDEKYEKKLLIKKKLIKMLHKKLKIMKIQKNNKFNDNTMSWKHKLQILKNEMSKYKIEDLKKHERPTIKKIINDSERGKKLEYVKNISCCVPLQPCGYNYNIGKLLLELCFSKEIQDFYKKKYGYYVTAFTTFGINGKSVQYSRSKNIKFLGYTTGEVPYLPEDLYKKCRNFLIKKGYDLHNTKKNDTKYKILKYFDYTQRTLDHKIPKGVYFGFTGKDARSFLRNEKDNFVPECKTIKEITKEWAKRWGKKRYLHLKNNNRLKTDYEFTPPLLKEYIKKEKRRLSMNKANKRYNEKLMEKLGDKYKMYRNILEKHRKENNGFDEEYEEYYNQHYHGIKLDISYVAGIIDGDGTISINSTNQSKGTVMVNIRLSQSYPKLLEVFQENYGGNIYKRNSKADTCRREYIWRICGDLAFNLLLKLKDHIILKYEQLLVCLDFQQYYNVVGKRDERTKLYIKVNEMNNKNYHTKNKPFEHINMKYIAGLFDAEGCIRISSSLKSWSMTIAQKNNTKLLDIIKILLKNGETNKTHWSAHIGKSNIVEHLKTFYPYLIVKKVQVEQIFKFIDDIKENNQNPLTKERLNYRKQLYEICCNEKHENIEISKLKLEEMNDRSKKIEKQIKTDIKNIEKSLRYDQMCIAQSIAKIGIKNPNYGKERKLSHSLKISKNATGKKRQITDEQIFEIRKLRKEGKTQAVVAKKFNVSRQCISKIDRRLTLPLCEINNNKNYYTELRKNKDIENKIKEKLTDEEYKEYVKYKTVKNKRTLTSQQLVIILRLKNKKIKVTQINDYLNFKNKNGENIKPGIIRDLWSGRTKLYKYDFECTDMTQDEYNKIINS